MEKLELKHLAPYLPYGLEFIYNGKRQELQNLHCFYSYDEDGNIAGKAECTRVICPRFGEMQCLITAIKPILRPLSDLIKETKMNGLLGLQYSEMQVFFSWHFDVFGLIEKGLAVDYNTVSHKNNSEYQS